MTKCAACARGPVGVEGHLDLFVLKMRGASIQFHCRTCSTLWVRTSADANYRWNETSAELDAVTVPRGNVSPDSPKRD